ncbi:hypothetical protein V1477_010503 [Vespula maculifrons]|uniref:Uncharacterized protein n=1 Tax=Vespula maculifrons TaxID=7453 RepID=A0ABD2C4R1_VESMC
MQSRDTRFRERTTKSGLGPNFTVTSSVVLWTSTRELRQFSRMPSIQTQMQIRDTRFRETTTKYGLGPTFTVTSSVELWTPTRELRNLRGCHPCNRLRETTTKSGLGPTFAVTSSVDFWTSTRELRQFSRMPSIQSRDSRLRETTTNSGLGAKFTVTSSVVLWTSMRELRQFSRMPSIQSRDSRSRETTTKSGLGPNFTVTSSVELWTSPRELRKVRGCHPCNLKYRVGIVGLERRQQSTVLDRTLQLLVQLCFGLRQQNLEIFADAIHASINEQLIQIYNSVFGCRLKCRVGIVGFGRRQQIRVLDRPFQLQLQLCFGLRRKNLEIFADAIHAKTTTEYGVGPKFTVTSSVVLLTWTGELRNLRGCHP